MLGQAVAFNSMSVAVPAIPGTAFSDGRLDVNRNALLVGLLVVALVVVLILWMNDRESQDASLDVNIGWVDAPELVEFV